MNKEKLSSSFFSFPKMDTNRLFSLINRYSDILVMLIVIDIVYFLANILDVLP